MNADLRPPLSRFIDRAACALAENIAADVVPNLAAIRAQRATLADLLRTLAVFARTMELADNMPNGGNRLAREATAANALYHALVSDATTPADGVVDLTQRRSNRTFPGGTAA